jgi:excinuclease ABC subunit A
MLKSTARSCIRLRGVRHNNLKNFELDLPINQLIVVTGLSGSGKSSLAFDTLFAEGQRRYIETFSPYARQFFDRMDKPKVDSIEGIPPAIAIEQRNAVKTTRSTVGTMTEICDYMKMLWPHVARLHCRQCGREVRKDSPQQIWESLKSKVQSLKSEDTSGAEVLVAFDLALSEKLSLEESLALVSKQGYQRLLVEGRIERLDEVLSRVGEHKKKLISLTVIQDRVRVVPGNRARFVEACEQAYHFGKGKLAVHFLEEPSVGKNSKKEPLTPGPLPIGWGEGERQRSAVVNPQRFSNRLHCAECDVEYREPTPALFSFNHPVGACPTCRGFGRVISIDYNLAIPDRSKTLAEGVVKPWLTGHGLESQSDLMRACRHLEIPTNVPFYKLAKKWQDFVIDGDPEYGKDEEHHWPRAWYGVRGYFRWLESKAYKMHVRVLLSRYRAYTPCPDCKGKRFQPEALLYRAEGRGLSVEGESKKDGLTLADFYQLPIRDACTFVEAIAGGHKEKANDPLRMVLNEVRARLGYLNEVGLGYLTLDRPTRSLSGGETERVNLTTCLGTRLVNTLFVLDEPSVGLHARDTERLVRILEALRDAGNTVVVVEHEASVMRAANQIVDLGPGHGATGGEVVFQGTYGEILKAAESLTGEYLSGRRKIETPNRRGVEKACAPGTLASSPRPSPPVEERGKRSGARATDEGRTPASSPRRTQLAESRSWLTYQGASPNEAWVLNDAPAGIGDCVQDSPWLRIENATRNNLKDLSVEIPLKRLVCVTGVSGSGKTTLIREVLLPALTEKLQMQRAEVKASARMDDEQNDDDSDESVSNGNSSGAIIEGLEHLAGVVLVDQSILGKTPRSNPAVYIGAFDDIREFFAQSELAKQRGLNASAFSFNSSQGQCERCRGAGFEKIEMQFLSDVFIRCPDCEGRRYRAHILEVKVQSPSKGRVSSVEGERVRGQRAEMSRRKTESRAFSIADLLDATVEEAVEFLGEFPESRPATRAQESLALLEEVGLGYLKLGQPINTLSGGESQRLKLVRHLAESVARTNSATNGGAESSGTRYGANVVKEETDSKRSTLFLFDEPTTGLHFDDVRVLLKVFQRLVDAGHSVLVIEHNLDVIKSADWIIDLGPDAGDQGGEVVAEGTPEQIANCEKSFTGQALRGVLQSSKRDNARKALNGLKKLNRLNEERG